jgi:hypothetical protein
VVAAAPAGADRVALWVEDVRGIENARVAKPARARSGELRFVKGAVTIGEEHVPLIDLAAIAAAPARNA